MVVHFREILDAPARKGERTNGHRKNEGVTERGFFRDIVVAEAPPMLSIVVPTRDESGNVGPLLDSINWRCKRLFDLVIVVCALPFLVPAFLILALAIKLDSPGPVFFVQKRVGSKRRRYGGQVVWQPQCFRCYKFRSMYEDADQSLHQTYIKEFINGGVEAATHGSAQFKLTEDPRITRVGRLLRKTSIDELPQLINVFRGEMSLVGPRPVPDYEVDCYSRADFERLTATPGITGLWQVKGRGNVLFSEMMRLDIDYARNQSFWRDMKILLLTIPAVFSGRGAE